MVVFVNVATAQTHTLYSTDFGTTMFSQQDGLLPAALHYGLIILPALQTTILGHRQAIMPTTAQAERRYLIFNNGLSTAVYSGIVVTWGARMTSTGASPTFQWSIDGTNWNTLALLMYPTTPHGDWLR